MFSGKLTARIPEGVRSAEGGRQTQNGAFGLPLHSHRISSELLSSQHWRSGSTRTVRSSWSSLAFPDVLSQWEFYGDPHPTLAHSLSLSGLRASMYLAVALLLFLGLNPITSLKTQVCLIRPLMEKGAVAWC